MSARHRQQHVPHERPGAFVEQHELATARVDVERAAVVIVRQAPTAQPGGVDDAARRETVAVVGDEMMQRCAWRLAKLHPGNARAEQDVHTIDQSDLGVGDRRHERVAQGLARHEQPAAHVRRGVGLTLANLVGAQDAHVGDAVGMGVFFGGLELTFLLVGHRHHDAADGVERDFQPRCQIRPVSGSLAEQFRLECARLGIVAGVDDRAVCLARTLTDIV